MDGCPISTEPKKCAAGMNRGLTRGTGDEGCSALVESTARGVSWAGRGGMCRVWGAVCGFVVDGVEGKNRARRRGSGRDGGANFPETRCSSTAAATTGTRSFTDRAAVAVEVMAVGGRVFPKPLPTFTRGAKMNHLRLLALTTTIIIPFVKDTDGGGGRIVADDRFLRDNGNRSSSGKDRNDRPRAPC
ncbi:hypothetical protein QTP88_015849 [Uroleucon formosanum]